MKVLYITSEASPFAVGGTLGETAGALAHALRTRLIGCRVVLPLYEGIPQELKNTMSFLTSLSVPVAWRRQYCGVFEAKVNGVIYYLLDNQYYFKRPGLYGHFDDAERFAFLSRAVLEMLPFIDFKPDIIHANDWQTALVPIYHNLYYKQKEGYQGIKTVYTIHNIQNQGKFGPEMLEDVLGIGQTEKHLVEQDERINLMYGAVRCADSVTTISPTYAAEICQPWHGYGLDNTLRSLDHKLIGILNGIDTDLYNPENDSVIAFPYTADDLRPKAANKQALQAELLLPADASVPIIGMNSRLVAQKGLDLVKFVLGELLQEHVQMIILGSGDWTYETCFREMQEQYPEKFRFCSGFNEKLAHKLYAGSDLFLIPSKSEPCGSTQMIACRYGAVPIVRKTGGLSDSVVDCANDMGNGFVFTSENANDMLYTLRRALAAFDDKPFWSALAQRAMRTDFSWGRTANEYIRLYRSLNKISE